MVRLSSPAKLRPWSEFTAKMVMGVVPGLVNHSLRGIGQILGAAAVVDSSVLPVTPCDESHKVPLLFPRHSRQEKLEKDQGKQASRPEHTEKNGHTMKRGAD